LGDAALPALQALVVVSFALLGWAAFRLGRQLFSAPVGVLFALILLTRDLLVTETLQASVDIPFMALVMWGAALEAERPRRGLAVLLLLDIGGLLRPEAWLFAAIYLIYLLPKAGKAERIRLAAAAAAAPLIWAALDLIITGDALFSLHGTQDLAAQLQRPRHVDIAVQAAPVYLKFILDEPVVWIGIAGCLVALYALYERSLLPAALGGLGLVSFLALGVVELPLLIRYLLLPGAMLALFCAVGAFGWLNLLRGGWLHTTWLAASAAVVLALLLSVPADRERIQTVRSWIAVRREAQMDLHDLATSATAKSWLRRCSAPIDVYTYRLVPLLAYWLDRPASSIGFSSDAPKRGLILSPATGVVAANFTLGLGESVPDLSHPKGFRPVSSNRSWILYARC
jgi:hypothetical protein